MPRIFFKMLCYTINFPNLAILFGTVIVIYGTFKSSETTMQVGGSIAGIGGTAYQVEAKQKITSRSNDEDEEEYL